MQRFKENDPTEEQVYNLILPELESIGQDLDDFNDGAYTCFKLGEVLYDTERDPMAGVISRAIFRQSFFAIHQLFTRPGTFDFYLEVFRAIFGQETAIEFEIPGPGQLVINIPTLTTDSFELAARELVDGEYVYSPLVTSDTADNIIGQGFVSLFTEEEINNLTNEISPNGIYTVVNLVEPD